MTKDDFKWNHIKFYFLCMFVGAAIFLYGWKSKTYDSKGMLIQLHSMPPMIVGGILIFLAFIGLIFFSDYHDDTKR